MDAFVYQADLYCTDCAIRIKNRLTYAEDSDRYPQGPHPGGGGESDRPQHCASCAVFLCNELTEEGYRYLRLAGTRDADSPTVQEWLGYYQPDWYSQAG